MKSIILSALLLLFISGQCYAAVELDADPVDGAVDVSRGGTGGVTAAAARTALGVPATASTLVGDCTVGPCLDGTADGGNLIKLWAGTGSFWTALQGGAPAANRSWRLPIAAAPGAGTTRLVNMDEYGQMAFVDPATFEPAFASDENAVTDAQLTVIGNTSGTNTGDNATNSQYSGLAASKQDADADLTYLAGFTPTANIKTILNAVDYAAVRSVLGYGSAATRAAEDTMTDGSNLPDGAAIKAYGDANWGGGVAAGSAGINQVYYWNGTTAGWTATLGLFDDASTTAADLGLSALEITTRLATKAANILTGYTSGAGTVAATDSVLQAIQKLNGNDAAKQTADADLDDLADGTLGETKIDAAVARDTEVQAKYIAGTEADFYGTLLDPQAIYTVDGTNHAVTLITNTPAAFTITAIRITCDADPTTEQTLTFAHKAAGVGYGTPTTIEAVVTTAGVANITSGIDDATIPANTKVFATLSDPDDALNECAWQIEGDWD